MSDPVIQPEKTTISRRDFLVTTVAAATVATAAHSVRPAITLTKPSRLTKTLGHLEDRAGTLKYAEVGSFTTFNPWDYTTGVRNVANQVFSRLIYLNSSGQLVYDLAESYHEAADGLSVELTLRPGVKWHDGSPVTANDFVTMYGYLSNPKLASELGVGKIKGQFTLVSGVTAPDNSTVRLEFSSPLTYWKNVLVYWYLIRVPDLSDWAFQKHLPIGTGPFKMTHYTQGLSATFEANTDYYRPTEPRLDGYSFIMYAAAPSELPNLESGYINGGLIASYADAKTLSDSSRYATQKAPLGCNYVLVNFVNSNLALKKAAVRQALAYSMDRKEYAAVAYSGFEIPTCTVWYAPATIAYSKSALDAYPFDLAKAASLLKSAGVVDLALTLAIDISDPNFESMAEIWQSDLQKIGVALTIKPVADAVWADLGSGVDTKGIDLISYDCGRCYQDPAILIGANPQFSGGSANPVGYRNAELEQLIVRGPGIVNPAKRRANYQQISQMLLSECPVLPTVSLTYIFGWEKKVSGYSADLIAGLRLADTTI